MRVLGYQVVEMKNVAVEKPKVRGKTKPGVELARQAYIYQGVSSTKELAAIGGVSEVTIWKHNPEWKREREVMLAKQSGFNVPSSLSVPNETLESHREDISFIRTRLDKAKSDLSNLPSIISELQQMVELFASDSDKLDDALQLLDRYFRLCVNEKAATKLFMDLKTLWDAKSGVDSLKNIQEAAGKAVAVANAKEEPSPEPTEAVAVGGVFSKRG